MTEPVHVEAENANRDVLFTMSEACSDWMELETHYYADDTHTRFQPMPSLLRTVDLWPRLICITCHQLTRAPQASGSYTDILVVPVVSTVSVLFD